jgi:bifunctional DNA-binding transcriptional regulator/antitoxin component of YhaV-PrlF toxin-antitoxin module
VARLQKGTDKNLPESVPGYAVQGGNDLRRLEGGMPMSEFVRELFSNGKITIPRELRRLHQLNDGDLVTLKIVEVIRGNPSMRSSASTEAGSTPSPTKSDAKGEPQ